MVFRAAVQNFPKDMKSSALTIFSSPITSLLLKYDSVHGRFKGEVSWKARI